MANQHIVAIEIGSSKVVGAVAEKTPTGHIEIDKLEEKKLSGNAVRYGIVQNVEEVRGCVRSILKLLENSLDGRISGVYLGLCGRSLHSEVSEVSRDLDPQRPITDDIINRIIKDAGNDYSRDIDVLEVVPRSYKVNHIETANPSGQFGDTIDIKVNLITAKTNINLNLGRVTSNLIPVRGMLITPLEVADHVLKDTEKMLGTMLVDIGAETTTVSIYKHSALQHLVTLPLGGRNITRDISTSKGILEETAEVVKKKISNPLDEKVENVNIEGINSIEAANYIKARTGEIIANINQQVAYAGLTAADLQNVVLLGGGAQLQGIAKSIEKETHLHVRMASYPQQLNILNHNINRKEYIQIFSLLATAANVIDDGDTCVELNYTENDNFDDSFGSYGRRSNDDDPLTRDWSEQEIPRSRNRHDSDDYDYNRQNRDNSDRREGNTKKKQRKGWFSSIGNRIGDRIGKLMEEPEEADNN